MARGYPDYQNPVNKVAGRLVDFSSIVTAMQGVSTLDGLGRLVWFDKFHDGLSAWNKTLIPADAFAVISTEVSEVTPSCLKLTPSVTMIGIGTALTHTQGFTLPSITGLEVSLMLAGGDAEIEIGMRLYYGGILYHMCFYYWPLTRQIALLAADGLHIIYTLPVVHIPNTWLTVKLVVDWPNVKGVRLLIGDLFFDISMYTIQAAALAVVDSLEVDLFTTANSVASLPQYLGHVYLTMDEP